LTEESEAVCHYHISMLLTIYYIQDNDTGCVYVGSTELTLEERMKQHVADWRRYVDDESAERSRCMSVFPILEGNNYTECVIEVYEAKDKDDVLVREGYWQRMYKDKYGKLLLNRRVEGLMLKNMTKKEKTEYYRLEKRKQRAEKREVKAVLDDTIEQVVEESVQLIGDYSEAVWV